MTPRERILDQAVRIVEANQRTFGNHSIQFQMHYYGGVDRWTIWRIRSVFHALSMGKPYGIERDHEHRRHAS